MAKSKLCDIDVNPAKNHCLIWLKQTNIDGIWWFKNVFGAQIIFLNPHIDG